MTSVPRGASVVEVLGGIVEVVVVGMVVVVVVAGTVVVVESSASGGLVLAGASGAFHNVNDRTPRKTPPMRIMRSLNAELGTGGTG
jgi:hypothetical protein